MRGGQAIINNGVIRTTSAESGKVGDSAAIIDSNIVCVDVKSNYYDAQNMSVEFNGGVFDVISGEAEALKVIADNNENNRIKVISASFAPPIDDSFVAEGSVNTITDTRSVVRPA